MKKNIRYITDGALIVAIYSIFLLICRFFNGTLEESLYFILPIPIIVYGKKYNFKSSIAVLFATVCIAFLLINPFSALFYVFPTVSLGAIYPLLEKRKMPTVLQFLIITIIYGIINLFTMVTFSYLLNYNIVDDIQSMVSSVIEIMTSLGVNTISATYLEALMISIIPSTIILVSILDALLLMILTKILLFKLKLSENLFENNKIALDNIPSFIGIIYIIIFALMMYSVNKIPLKDNLYVLYSIIVNIGLIFSFFMIYQGLFLVSKYCNLKKIKWLYVLACLSIFIFPIGLIIVGVIQNIFHISLKIS